MRTLHATHAVYGRMPVCLYRLWLTPSFDYPPINPPLSSLLQSLDSPRLAPQELRRPAQAVVRPI